MGTRPGETPAQANARKMRADWIATLDTLIGEIKADTYRDDRLIDGEYFRQQSVVAMLAGAREILP